MKIKFLLIVLNILLFSCKAQNCPDKINILPMYGNVEKCKEQIESDIIFLQQMDKLHADRKTAALEMIKNGWNYFYNNDYETAMKRFNQAWLLDPSLYEIYWGFGNITAINGNPKEAIDYFDMAKKLNPINSNFYVSSSLAYLDVYLQENRLDKDLLKNSINDLEIGVKLDSKNAKLYEMLSISYFYLNNIKKAKEFLKKAEDIDASSVNQQFKNVLKDY